MVLSHAKYVSVASAASEEGQTAQAQHVVVHSCGRMGRWNRVEADGEVTLTNGAGGRVTAPRGEMHLNAQNQPQSADDDWWGGVCGGGTAAAGAG